MALCRKIQIGQARFCSRDCYFAMRRQIKQPREQDIKALRRKYRLKHTYGLSVDDTKRLFDRADNKCEICGVEQCPSGRALCIDHDHATGEIRGILCNLCNTGLAKFRDNPDALNAAVVYLMRPRSLIGEAAPS